MDRHLSEESLDLLRDMVKTEAWRIFEGLQKDAIENSRALATNDQTMIQSPTQALWHAAEAAGREKALREITDMCHDSRSKSDG